MTDPIRTVDADWYIAVSFTESHFVPGDVPTKEIHGRPTARGLCDEHLAYVDRDGRVMAELGERCPACKDALARDPQVEVSL